jgi:hypothetical protein
MLYQEIDLGTQIARRGRGDDKAVASLLPKVAMQLPPGQTHYKQYQDRPLEEAK